MTTNDPEKLTRQQRRALARAWDKAYLEQPYVQGQRAAMPFLERGKLYITDVYHDEWCPFLNGGLCRCEPDIVIKEWTGEE